jgi:small subunit ribosomal protein S6e
MKLNIAYPENGTMKTIEIDDDKQLAGIFDKRLGAIIDGELIGQDYKGYVFKIFGGSDDTGVAMKQGVMTSGRTKLLLSKESTGWRGRAKRGCRKRKTVRGCIISPELSLISLVVKQVGETPIAGLTDVKKDRRLAPKRVGKIRKLFGLTKKDDVRAFVVHNKEKKQHNGPKIQRLITPARLQQKRKLRALKRSRYEATQAQAKEFNAMIAERVKEAREAAKKRRRSSRNSRKASQAAAN